MERTISSFDGSGILLAGIFDGATITTIMGIITLTILLSSGMKSVHIVQILLLLVVATNIGGVWFVLGEPANILAAAKLGPSPIRSRSLAGWRSARSSI